MPCTGHHQTIECAFDCGDGNGMIRNDYGMIRNDYGSADDASLTVNGLCAAIDPLRTLAPKK